MRNTFKIFGISIMVVTMLLTVGAGILAEEPKAQAEEDAIDQDAIDAVDEISGHIEEVTEAVDEMPDNSEGIIEAEESSTEKETEKEEPVDTAPKGQKLNEQEQEEEQVQEEQISEEQVPETAKLEEASSKVENLEVVEPNIPINEPIKDISNDGKLTIKLKLEKGKSEDKNREFDFYIYGPDGTEYTMSLTSNSSLTLEGLKYGKYRIKEIVPMDFVVKGGSTAKVTISVDESEKKIVITNKRKKVEELYHYDEMKNTFKVGF